jgi:glutamate synthase domain-containing protein 2
MSPRQVFFAISFVLLAVLGGLTWWSSAFGMPLAAAGTLFLLGLYDMVQKSHAIRRNFPVAGRFRYIFESVRPELQQYFVESNASGRPFSRDLRSLVYQRAKNVTDTVPFGTEKDVYEVGYEWINHSLVAKHPHDPSPRVRVGGPDCTKPYDAALLNVSAMSYGALSTNAIRALNRGAKLGGFAHNTGEGGISPYHLEEGGDLVWQIGTGYFGCRDARAASIRRSSRRRPRSRT